MGAALEASGRPIESELCPPPPLASVPPHSRLILVVAQNPPHILHNPPTLFLRLTLVGGRRYSCSWPAYINGGNETKQPFATFIDYGCNGWRNWHDVRERNNAPLPHSPAVWWLGSACVLPDSRCCAVFRSSATGRALAASSTTGGSTARRSSLSPAPATGTTWICSLSETRA